MRMTVLALLASAALPLATAAPAQTISVAQPLSGTRLDISATGEVTRVPDVAIISAGVATQAATATDALAQNSTRMERVRAALKRAGIADRDIQTASINLSPQYKYADNQPPLLTGYQASNQLTVKFRDIRSSGRILDALVSEGSNQINGPNLTIDKPEAALDEARAKAIAVGKARADLYARSLGLRVARVISVSESSGYSSPPPMPMVMRAMDSAQAKTSIDPGEQQLQVTVAMSFELQ